MRLAVVLRVILSSLALVFAVRSAEAVISFQAGTPIDLSDDPPGDGIQAIAVADLNHDNRADLIVVQPDTGDVSVFLNSGSGSFNAPTVLPSTLPPVAVTTGDFNNDGNVDMAVVNYDDSVTIYLGNGTGNFSGPGNNYPGCGDDVGAVGVVAAYLDADSYEDLAVLCDSTVYLLRSVGDGTFSPFSTPSLDTRGSGNFAIAAGRINNAHNGYVDLAISSAFTDSVSVFFGNNDGTFQSPFVIQSGLSNPQGLAIGEFDQGNDSIPDIAVISGPTDQPNVLILVQQPGGGAFTVNNTASQSTLEPGAVAIEAVDLDQDGLMDLVAGSNGDGGEIQLYCQEPTTCEQGGACSALCYQSPLVYTHPNQVKANFQIQVPLVASTGSLDVPVNAVKSGDLNGDGRPDLVAVEAGTNTIRILLNTTSQVQPTTPPTSGSGTPQPTATPTPTVPTPTPTVTSTLVPTATPTPIPTAPYGLCRTTLGVPPAQGNIEAAAIGDFNNDGKPDIAVADTNGNRVIVSLRQPSPSPGPTACDVLGLTTNPVSLTVTAPVALAAEDFNRDGNLDLAVVGSQGLTVFFGDGSGGFPSRVDLTAHTGPSALAVADFNHDSWMDLVVANAGGSNDVSIFLNNGHGGFDAACDLPVQISPALVLAGDLNRDGLQDFAVASRQENVLVAFLQNAPPSPTPGTPTPSTGVACPSFTSVKVANLTDQPQAMTLGNFESGNVIPDFAVALSGGVQVVLGSLTTSGGITYRSLSPTLVLPGNTPQPAAIAVADVYGDGRTDLIVADKANGAIDIFVSTGSATFKPLIPFDVGANPIALAVADIDRDGVADVVTGNTDGSISVLLTSRPPPTPTPLSTDTPTVTGTPTPMPSSTATPTPTPSSTATPTATGTRLPTSTPVPSPVPTNTMKPGTLALQGSCAVDPAASPYDWTWLALSIIVTGGLAWRRIARGLTR